MGSFGAALLLAALTSSGIRADSGQLIAYEVDAPNNEGDCGLTLEIMMLMMAEQ